MGAAMVGPRGGLPAHEGGDPLARSALAHRPGRRQAPRPAEPDPAFVRQHPYKTVDIDLPKIPKAQLRPNDATEGLSAGQLIHSHY
jgi:hypothetical protein